MDATQLKVISFFVIFILGAIFTLLPFLLIKRKFNAEELILSLGNALAGGIFLAAGFVDLLPESAEGFEDTGIDWKLPMSQILCVLGFLFIFLIEKLIFMKDVDVHHSHSPIESSSSTDEKKKLSEPPNDDKTSSSTHEMVPLQEIDINSESNINNTEIEVRVQQSEGHGHDHHAQFTAGLATSSYLPFMLLIILSIHSFISGFALGAEPDVAGVSALLIAIVSHKWTEAFALGISLIKANLSKLTLMKCVIVYGLMEPMGIILGGILSVVIEGSANLIIQAFTSGIASGTFIYIALVDILLEEFSTSKHKWLKFLVCIIGFAVMSLSALLFEHDAEHTA